VLFPILFFAFWLLPTTAKRDSHEGSAHVSWGISTRVLLLPPTVCSTLLLPPSVWVKSTLNPKLRSQGFVGV